MKHTYEEVKNTIESTGEYKLLSKEYINNRTKLKILYKDADYAFEVDFDHWLRNRRLPKSFIQDMADKHNAYTEKKNADFQKEIDAVYHGEVQLVSNFVTTKQDIKVRHCKCGSEYMVNPRYLLYQNLGCLTCALDKMRKYENFREVQEEFDKLSPDDKYTILDDLDTKYENKEMHVNLRHEKCGNEYKVRISNFKSGTRCPKCACRMTSKEEKELASYIQSIYNGKCELNFRFSAREPEMDAYLPNLKIGFEFCGMYWHSSAIEKNINYHLDKMKYFANRGIFVVQIFEDEWITDNKNTKEKIKRIINNDQEVYTEDVIKLDLRWNKCPELNLIEGYELSEILPPSYYNISNSRQSSKNVRFSDDEVLEHPELKFYKIYDCGYSVYKKIKQ